jgi:4,5-dihydroxyphthalate decarboxylase
MRRLHLSLAITPCDHVSDLKSGLVLIEGIDLTCMHFQTEEVFFRTIVYRDFDVSEISLAKYASMRSQGDRSLPSQYFRRACLATPRFISAGMAQ